MATSDKIARAIIRAQKTQERIAALKAALLEEEREADRVLGEAVRQAVDNPRSRWANNINLTVKEFYSLVVGIGAGDDEPRDNETEDVGGLDSEDGASAADEVGGVQGF